jgi:hypothetical protein
MSAIGHKNIGMNGAPIGRRSCGGPFGVALIVGIVEDDRCAVVAALDYVERGSGFGSRDGFLRAD